MLNDSTDSSEGELTAVSPQPVIEQAAAAEPKEQEIRLLLAAQKSPLTAETEPSCSEAGNKGTEVTLQQVPFPIWIRTMICGKKGFCLPPHTVILKHGVLFAALWA